MVLPIRKIFFVEVFILLTQINLDILSCNLDLLNYDKFIIRSTVVLAPIFFAIIPKPRFLTSQPLVSEAAFRFFPAVPNQVCQCSAPQAPETQMQSEINLKVIHS